MGCVCPKKKNDQKQSLINPSDQQIEISRASVIKSEQQSHYRSTQLQEDQYEYPDIFISTEGKMDSNAKKISSDDFNFLKVIGRGSFGKVMLVEKKDTKKLYAMKILKKGEIKRRNQQVHTQQERQIIQNCNSPFIVQLHYAFQTKEKLYLVMDFMRGGELFFHLKQSYKFSEKRAKFFIAELILALEALHKNDTIYRDLKPENVLLDEHGHIKLCDFGLSKEGVKSQDGEKTNTFCGTPEYLAPEILRRKGHDKSVDWWGLGCLLYEMIGGCPPHYQQESQRQMMLDIATKPAPMQKSFSPQAKDFLTKLLKIDPTQRLGYSQRDSDELKEHPFFNGMNWKLVYQKKMQPPIIPKLKNKKDVSYFDEEFTREEIVDSPVTTQYNTVGQTLLQDNYQNFTYQPADGGF